MHQSGEPGQDGSDAQDSLVTLSDEAPGEGCDFGGVWVATGLDTNGDGVLDVGEITDEELFCFDNPFRSAYGEVASFSAAELPLTPMMLAWDGASYWTASGGSTNDILEMTAPGTFTLDVTLGGQVEAQAAVVWDDTRSRFVSNNYGVVQRWDASGTPDTDVELVGYGSLGSEAAYPQGRHLAVVGALYATYTEGTLSLWNPVTGERLTTTTLTGAGTTFGSHFSASYANGMVWIIDDTSGTWRAFDVPL